MRRFFDSVKKINWKYVLGEIFLIFIGINLAIWFNNWNNSLQLNRNKKIVIVNVKEEILNNLEELSKARKVNQLTLDALKEYNKIYGKTSSELIATPARINELDNKFPSFFKTTDSVRINQDTFKYSGGTNINLELAELTEIAWKTSQSMNIANEFNYDCLFQLESMYNLQSKVIISMDNAAETLQGSDINKLTRVLNVLSQYDEQLEKDYRNALMDIENCN